MAAAQDGLFPAMFGRVSARGVPAFGIVLSVSLATALLLIEASGSDHLVSFYRVIVNLSTMTAAVSYVFCAGAAVIVAQRGRSPARPVRVSASTRSRLRSRSSSSGAAVRMQCSTASCCSCSESRSTCAACSNVSAHPLHHLSRARELRHDGDSGPSVRRPLRGREAAHRDGVPAGSGAPAAHARQLPRSLVRRRDLGARGAEGPLRLRAQDARTGRGGPRAPRHARAGARLEAGTRVRARPAHHRQYRRRRHRRGDPAVARRDAEREAGRAPDRRHRRLRAARRGRHASA